MNASDRKKLKGVIDSLRQKAADIGAKDAPKDYDQMSAAVWAVAKENAYIEAALMLHAAMKA